VYVSEIIKLGAKHIEAGRHKEALELAEKYLKLAPEHPDLLNLRGLSLIKIGEPERAIECLKKAIPSAKNRKPLFDNLGLAYTALGHFDKLRELCGYIIKENPEDVDSKVALGNLALLQGDYKAGFSTIELRWRIEGNTFPESLKSRKRWGGEPIPGKTLLFNREQGHGDFLQMVRFLPEVIKYSQAKVVIRHHPSMTALLVTSFSGDIILSKQDAEPPPFDQYIHLFDLPELMGIDVWSIPNAPYIFPSVSGVRAIKPLIPKGCTVGVAWQGNPEHKNDRHRSIPHDQFMQIFDGFNGSVVSLQKGRSSYPMEDFADTAAIISQLDLVITVDTSVAHLAGAMGKPVWNLITYVPDWRWMLNRSDSPWYPSMRLFRQAKPGDWDSVIPEVRNALAEQFRT
jgi:hypothetical protein